jgi:branched-chain amino acid transport system permease protein
VKPWQWGLLVLVLCSVAAAAAFGGEAFALQLATRIVILSIAAVGVQLIVGHGNLITLGHALFFGVGVYVAAACSYFGGAAPWLTLGPVQLVLLLCAGLLAGVTGELSLRMRGIHFLMITLAFGQMFHLAAVSATIFGGDDGMTIRRRPWFPLIDLNSPYQRYALACLVLLACLYLSARLVLSSFGLALRASASNEPRLATSGYDVHRIRLVAYVISGLVVALAGYLHAVHSEFASPGVMHWTRSGDLVIMVILGGRLRGGGPVLGAAALVLIEEIASRYTVSWPIVLGVLLVAVASFKSFDLLKLPALRALVPNKRPQ